MALSSLAQDTREIKTPNQRGKIEFQRTHSASTGPLSLKNTSICAYSDESGGRGTFSPMMEAEEMDTDRDEDPSILINFEVYTGTAVAGSDHIISYEIEDGNGNVEEFELFLQNGIWNPKTEATLLSRISSEFERLSETFEGGDAVLNVTDFSSSGIWSVSEGFLEFVSESSGLEKHTDERVPYYAAGDERVVLQASDQLFDTRDGSIFVALQWDQLSASSEPILQVTQGGNLHAEVRNEMGDLTVESDFADATLYQQPTFSGDVVLVEVKTDTDSQVQGAVNREIDNGPAGTTGSFSSGTTEIVLNPNGTATDLKLFEFLAFPEAKDFRFSNKVASMFSYLYNVDMTENVHVEKTTHTGSPDISNYLFYDERTDVLDLFVGFYGPGTPRLRKLDPEDSSEIWTTSATGDVLDIVLDNLGFVLFADEGSDDVTKLTKSGGDVWEFPTSDADVTISEELKALTLTTDDIAVAAFGTDVYGINRAGQRTWMFGGETENISDVAATDSGRTYVGKVEPDSAVILLDSEGEEISRFTGHLNDVSAIVAGNDGSAYSGAVNSEIRFSNDSGNQFEKLTDVHETGKEIRDLDVDTNYLYTASADGKAKKIEINTTDEVWALDFTAGNFIETNIDAIDSNGTVGPGDVSLSPLSVTVNPNGEVYVVIEDDNDKIDNHIFKVNSSKSVLWVEPFPEAHTVSVQPGPEASQWT